MRRSFPLLLAAGLTAGLAAAPAEARVRELAAGPELGRPSCPDSPCLAVARTTAFQAKVGPTANGFVAPEAGRVVAFTLALGRPTRRQAAFFASRLGGAASAQVTVLKPSRDRRRYRVQAQSQPVALEPWFGRTAQFPLEQSLAVERGWTVALTIPTWAPALDVGLPATDGWRASRPPARCTDTFAQTAQLSVKALAPFTCLYRRERLTYSATLITTP